MTRISISAQIPRMLNEMKRSDVVHKKDLLADYVMEAVGLIGTYHDLDFCPGVVLDVENHTAQLPPSTFDVEDVNICIAPVSGWSGGWRAHCSCSSTPCSCFKRYSKAKMIGWRMEGCEIVDIPQASGIITVDLWALPLDKEGMPMLFESTAMAARAYLRYVFSESLLEENIINQGTYDRRKARWEELCTITREAQLVPTRDRLAYAARINNDPLKSRRYFGRR